MLSNKELHELGITLQDDGKYAYGEFSNLTYDKLLATLDYFQNPGTHNTHIATIAQSLIEMTLDDSQIGEYELIHGDAQLGKKILTNNNQLRQSAIDLLQQFRP
jgi:hypothetical protein